MIKRSILVAASCLVFGLCVNSCRTGVEPSPSPGIVRVTLKSIETDTTIIIQNDTSRFSRWDEFYLYISQGKIYRGHNHALLYAEPSIARVPGDTVNIIRREWLSGVPIKPTDFTEINTRNSRYIKYVILESYVPPGEYDSLAFALTANEILIFLPKVYMNPVQLPPGTHPQMQFPAKITVNEGRVTQVDLEIFPFSSLYRYRDSYLFGRKIRVASVENL
ncbi:MAG: hypothetical protein FJ217_04595 [Ignavibacteria bacterium]|nr:hypothetical protein [Ignavibacteria bacterium]